MTDLKEQRGEPSSSPTRPRQKRRASGKRAHTPRQAKPAAEVRPRVVVVLGMHRSGTSVVARGLQALGVDLGDKLLQGIAGENDKGFFEDHELMGFNSRLLAQAGSAWHGLSPLDRDALAGAAFSAQRREAARLLTSKLKSGAVFGFKDPRTAVLLPLWRCVFDDFGIDDRYVIALRHPLESAASLEHRNKMPQAKGVLLWAKHILGALRDTQDKPRTFVHFDDILDAPEQELRRVARALGLNASADSTQNLAQFRDEFLASELRHHRVGAKELRRSGVAPALVEELYDVLIDLTRGDGEATGIKADRLRAIEARFEELSPVLKLADELDAARETALQRAESGEKRLADVDRKLGETNARLQTAEEMAHALEGDLTSLQEKFERERAAALAELDQNARLEAKLRDAAHRVSDAQIARLKDEIASVRVERESALATQRAAAAQDRQDLQNAYELQIASLHTEIEKVRAESAAALERQKADAAAEATRNAEIEAQLREAALRVSELEAAQLQSDLEAARSAAAGHAATEAALKEANSELVQLRVALDTQAHALQKTEASLDAARSAGEQARRVHALEATRLKLALEEQRLKLAAIEHALAGARAEAGAARAAALEELNLRTAETASYLKEKAELDAALKQASADLAAFEHALAGARAEAGAARAAALEELNLRTAETAAHLNVKAELEAELGRARADLAAALETGEAERQQAKSNFETMRVSLEAELDQARSKLEAAHKAAAAESAEHVRTQLRFQALLDELEHRSAALQEAHAARSTLQKELKQADAQANYLLAQFMSGQEDNERLQDALTARQSELRQVSDAHADARQRLDLTESRLGETLSALSDAWQDIERLRAQLLSKERARRDVRRELLLSRAALHRMQNSVSWRSTAIFRAGAAFFRDPFGAARRMTGRVVRAAWRRIPLTPEGRGKLANSLFEGAPFLFFWSGRYQNWKRERGLRSGGGPPS